MKPRIAGIRERAVSSVNSVQFVVAFAPGAYCRRTDVDCTRPLERNGLGNTIAATGRLTSRIETFFTILPDSIETYRHWRRLVVTYEVKGAKVHDAKLVATMLVYEISHILTFNGNDFKRFPGITALDPTEI